jgi:hypothetical protein
MSNAWKNTERKVAKRLGGKRRLRGADFSQSMGDVEHPLFSIEVKYRKRLPVILTGGLAQARRCSEDGKVPILVLKEARTAGEMVVISLRDFEDLLGRIAGPVVLAKRVSVTKPAWSDPGFEWTG